MYEITFVYCHVFVQLYKQFVHKRDSVHERDIFSIHIRDSAENLTEEAKKSDNFGTCLKIIGQVRNINCK